MKTKTKQIVEEIKEDYVLIEKEYLLKFLLVIYISLFIGACIYGAYSITIDYGENMKQQGRNELMNEIFEGYDNLPCGEEFKLVNNSLENRKEITIKKEGCFKLFYPYYQNLSLGGFK